MEDTIETILLVGAGPMAIDYAKVLKDLKKPFIVVGRGKKSATQFQDEIGLPVFIGGIKKWTENNKDRKIPEKAIVAVTENKLGEVARSLINYGINKILLEKPGGLDEEDIKSVGNLAKSKDVEIIIAYNRRFYASTKKAKEIIEADGGVKSFTFEFTEWSHIIEKIEKAEGVKENWFLQNSTHVIDLAFYLGGEPIEIQGFKSGSLKWHSSGAIFTGAGITNNGSLFSYHSNWAAPGRWWVEILTAKHRLIFKPMESLQIQNIGSVKIEDVEIDDLLDKKYKPGLYVQVKAFLSGNNKNFINIYDQIDRFKIYNKIN